jgi:site-specific DNA-methyltransferase (adenine-specific)
MDFFAGSGTFGESAIEHGRHCILVDDNPEALAVMERRFAGVEVSWVNWTPSDRLDAPVQGRLPL